MSGRWHRLGRLYAPPDPPLHPALASHAANPLTAWLAPSLAPSLRGDRVRILYNGRDAANRSAIGQVEIDLAARTVLSASPEPLVLPGPPGGFGADGISIGGWLDVGERRWLLVMGWTLDAAGGWRGTIGRIACDDDGLPNGTPEPILAPDGDPDPISLSYPCAYRDADDRLTLLYESTQPGDPATHPLHRAWSPDGDTWLRDGSALPPVLGLTTGYSRPTVLRRDGMWHLWASRLGPAGERYHIGHATSADGRVWTADRAPALLPSGDEWDATMVCYPHVFDHGGVLHMLYCGDGFGRTGFGLARWEDG